MIVDERVQYETRVRARQALLAALAAFLLLGASIMQLIGPHTKVSELTLDLITAHKRYPLDLIAAIVNALGSLALAATLSFLYGATRARNPQLQPFVRILAIAGAVVAGIAGIAYAIVIADKANQFVSSGTQTYPEAHHLATSGGLLAMQLVGQAAALVLAIGICLISLNAMRIGLLTRFMGYLGIVAGVLVLFQITQVPVVQAYWLLALAYLFTGRWPTGVPPAWASGRAEKWPSAQEVRAQRAGRAGGRGGAAEEKPPPKPAPEAVGAPSGRTRSATPKRKRKRRR